jgi:hypothetical protein
MDVLAPAVVADGSLIVTTAEDALLGLSIVFLITVFAMLTGFLWNHRFGRFRSSCEHVLQKPHGFRMSEEGLAYSCANCDLVIRRRDDNWPPWCSEHPGPVVGRQAPTEFWTCGWPRCVLHHGFAGWLRYWRDLVRRWTWCFLDRSMEQWWRGGFVD